MKKWLVIVVIILGLLLAAVYLFFPKILTVSNAENINCNINNINRFVMAEDNWVKWWPGSVQHDSISNKKTFVYNGYKYLITEFKYNAVTIRTQGKGFTIDGTIFFLPLGHDSLLADWRYLAKTGLNPIHRMHLYWETKKVKNNMAVILKSMKSFLEKKENVYGIFLHESMSTDSTLIATKCATKSYPSTTDIYNLIADLKKYIVSQGAKENNFPMLNVRKLNDTSFEAMVAIPINRSLPDNGKLFFRRFVPWKVLTAEIRGGAYTVNEALTQMKNYMDDYQKTAMAIPFQSLVTDRSTQPDTSKWITRIYTPVP